MFFFHWQIPICQTWGCARRHTLLTCWLDTFQRRKDTLQLVSHSHESMSVPLGVYLTSRCRLQSQSVNWQLVQCLVSQSADNVSTFVSLSQPTTLNVNLSRVVVIRRIKCLKILRLFLGSERNFVSNVETPRSALSIPYKKLLFKWETLRKNVCIESFITTLQYCVVHIKNNIHFTKFNSGTTRIKELETL